MVNGQATMVTMDYVMDVGDTARPDEERERWKMQFDLLLIINFGGWTNLLAVFTGSIFFWILFLIYKFIWI